MTKLNLQRIENNVFTYCCHSYDVSKAVNILLDRNTEAEVGCVAVADVEVLLSQNSKNTIKMGIGVNWGRVNEDIEKPDDKAEIDLSIPIIFAHTKAGNFLPIDGYHRIAKAMLKGVESLPAVALTKRESKKIWL